MTPWEETAQKLGHSTENEMWKKLYALYSVSQLAGKFGVSQNVVRTRLEKCGIEMRKRGGANNVKVEVDEELIQDIIQHGVPFAAKKRGVTPQSIYRRMYYQYGLSVKQLREKAKATHQAALTQQPHEEPVKKEEEAIVPKPESS